jgi:hypothetical protein
MIQLRQLLVHAVITWFAIFSSAATAEVAAAAAAASVSSAAHVSSGAQQQQQEPSSVHVCLGANLGPHVSARVLQLLRLVVQEVHEYDVALEGEGGGEGPEIEGIGPYLVLALGDCPWSRGVLPEVDLAALPSEGFRLVTRFNTSSGRYAMHSNGQRLMHGYKSEDVSSTSVSYGAIAGVYHALELLGFAFLHPLSPTIPDSLRLPLTRAGAVLSLDATETPYWPIRIFHHHTQHPLELTEVLQGLDVPMFGPLGPDCVRAEDWTGGGGGGGGGGGTRSGRGKAGGPYCERWEDMASGVDRLFEWCVANKYNRVEWLLLGNYKWKGFDYSDTRRKRMKILCNLGHQYGLLVGADVPLGNVQQHGWYMVNPRLPYYQQVS